MADMECDLNVFPPRMLHIKSAFSGYHFKTLLKCDNFILIYLYESFFAFQ